MRKGKKFSLKNGADFVFESCVNKKSVFVSFVCYNKLPDTRHFMWKRDYLDHSSGDERAWHKHGFGSGKDLKAGAP